MSTLGLAFEAEDGVLTAPMQRVNDANASGSAYVASPTANSGTVSFTFSVPITTEYRVWVRTYGADATHDSFHIDLDGDGEPTCDTDGDTTCPHIFDVGEQIQPCEDRAGQFCNYSSAHGAFWWNILNDRITDTCGVCSSSNFIERRLVLAAGNHTLKFRQREPDARLDKFIITSNLEYEPATIETQPAIPRAGSKPLRVRPAPTVTP